MRDYFEKLYEEEACKWGLKPDFILTHYLDLFPKGKVLDLGMGEGRNALFLAERGFDVEGIDLSRTAVERCLQMAREKNVNISAHVGD
ncbi:MAG: class I SAM-dependent methyltransferase [Candidatus Bathycorpusculaceae bacterium]